MNKASLTNFFLHLHPRFIDERATRVNYTWCLGGLALWMFVVEVVSGILLALYYIPHVSQAYASIQHITHVAPYGFFLRNIHYWAGQAMVVLVALHTIRVFIAKAYAPPRQWNWLLGLALLVMTFLVDFTGYLLVWDDRGLWAWTIAGNLAASIPFIGQSLSAIVFGPSEPHDITLARLYAWHVLGLPAAMTTLMTWHFWRIRADGITKPL